MIPKKFNLEKKIALIVGTGRGWHTDLATYLCEAGASVIVVGQDNGEMEKAANALKGFGEKVECVTEDISKREEIEKAVNSIIDKNARIDILVNNIDMPLNKQLLDMTEDDWHRTVHGTLDLLFLWCQTVGRHMVERRQGRVINISSILSERAISNSSAYCTSNGGVSQFTRALAIEWARNNITVNSIGIGWAGPNLAEETEAENQLRKYIPLRRFCRSEDIAGFLIFLASSSSGYVTGQTYFVSGGVMSHG